MFLESFLFFLPFLISVRVVFNRFTNSERSFLVVHPQGVFWRLISETRSERDGNNCSINRLFTSFQAVKGGYAIPAYNFNNMEQLQAIMLACCEKGKESPVILQVLH